MRWIWCVPFLLAACATPEQQAAQRAAEMQAIQQQQANYHNQLALRCSSFGFQRGTTEHANCMMQLHQQVMQQANQPAPASIPPRCSQLPPGLRGYAAAQGRCF